MKYQIAQTFSKEYRFHMKEKPATSLKVARLHVAMSNQLKNRAEKRARRNAETISVYIRRLIEDDLREKK